MAKTLAPIVLILGQDSFRADRGLAQALKDRGAEPSEVVRIWGDEASFADVFAAAAARSLFSDRTVVVVRRAEKLRCPSCHTERTYSGDDFKTGVLTP